MTSSQQITRSYLLIAGLYTLPASVIWGINTLFLLDAGLTIGRCGGFLHPYGRLRTSELKQHLLVRGVTVSENGAKNWPGRRSSAARALVV